MKPLLSIIIPLYNNAQYISRCVESIIAQDFRDDQPIEIIIVNDGSTDNAIEIVTNLQKKYDSIRLINQENKGVSAARNRGIDEAKGKYIYFIDPDDALSPGYFTTFLDWLEKEEAEILCFNFVKVSQLIDKTPNQNIQIISINHPSELPLQCRYVCVCHIINLNLLRVLGLRFNEELITVEDTIFVIELLYSKIIKIGYYCGNVYLYIHNEKSVTNNPNILSKKTRYYLKIIHNLTITRQKLTLDNSMQNFLNLHLELYSRDYVDAMFLNQICLKPSEKLKIIKYFKQISTYPSYRKVNGFKLKAFEMAKNNKYLFIIFSSIHKLFKVGNE